MSSYSQKNGEQLLTIYSMTAIIYILLIENIKKKGAKRSFYMPYVDVSGSLNSGIRGGANVKIMNTADIRMSISTEILLK